MSQLYYGVASDGHANVRAHHRPRYHFAQTFSSRSRGAFGFNLSSSFRISSLGVLRPLVTGAGASSRSADRRRRSPRFLLASLLQLRPSWEPGSGVSCRP
jgi:hypothetical protein